MTLPPEIKNAITGTSVDSGRHHDFLRLCFLAFHLEYTLAIHQCLHSQTPYHSKCNTHAAVIYAETRLNKLWHTLWSLGQKDVQIFSDSFRQK